jgi:hypothetical protein
MIATLVAIYCWVMALQLFVTCIVNGHTQMLIGAAIHFAIAIVATLFLARKGTAQGEKVSKGNGT